MTTEPDPGLSLVPLVLTLDEARACASAVRLGDRVEIVRPVRWIPAHTGMRRDFLHDFSRAWVDHGFPMDDAGDVMPMDRWGEGSRDPAPESAYRQHYLHVPCAHPADGWDWGIVQRVYGPVDVGDVFCGKETWRPCLPDVIEFRADGQRIAMRDPRLIQIVWRDCHWRPSTSLPRWASRLRLPVESVAVERAEGPDAPESGWRWRWGCRVELVNQGSGDPAVGPAASAARPGGQQGRDEGR